jgi:signal transduction histidine kinase
MNDPRSLHARLMLLYTGSGLAVLATLCLVIIVCIFTYVTRPLAHDLARTVAKVEAGLADPSVRDVDVARRWIVAHDGHDDIVAFAIPLDVARQEPTRLPVGEISIASIFGLGPQFVKTHDTVVVIVPKSATIDWIFRTLYIVVAVSLGLALWIAWLAARIATRETLKPLLTVTAELERFGRGDFTPQPQRVSNQVEFGALAAAYNAAASKVTEAFLERRRVEDQVRQFVAEAGHELRTPLTVVAGYIDVLRRGGLDDPAIRGAAFASLTSEIKRMRILVERLMTLARLDRSLTAEPEVVDVTAIVRQAIDALGVIAQSTITLDAASDLLVLGEPVDVYEVVANLIENALKYGEKTPIAVTVARAAEAAIRVRVRDGGPGIADGDRARIFERFYRGTDRGEITGSGLGLAIAAKAAERLGGRIELEDARAGSTTFTLIVPALDGISPLPAQRAAFGV